jgi:two-component system chemotaxis sensor kinase CheA
VSEENGEFLELFRDEADERLGSMIDAVLSLEAGQGGRAAIDSLFRDAHTIKGGAGMLGLEALHEYAHAVEDVLEGVRASGEFPPDLAEPLLRAVDVMRRQLIGGGEKNDVPDLLDDLKRNTRGRAKGVQSEVPVESFASTEEPTRERRGIRVAPEKIDRLVDLVGESVLHRRRLEHVLSEDNVLREREVSDELDLGARLLDALKDSAIGMRTLPVASITGQLPRAVRDIALGEGKQVELTISGGDTELDRVILEGLYDPLVHLVRNAVAHGIEMPAERVEAGKAMAGAIGLRAVQRGGMVEITVSDDGRGVSQATLDEAGRVGSLAAVLGRAGFSTADEVSALSGRGVGLDAVKRHVESFSGTLEVQSEPGRGTEIVMHFPLALALLDVLLIERGSQVYGLPLASVDEVSAGTERLWLEGRPVLELHGTTIPLADIADLIGASAPALASRAPVIAVSAGGRRIAAVCDRLLGEEEVVVKPLGQLLAGIHGYLGGAILGDGRVALLLDPVALVQARRRAVPRNENGSVPAKRLTPKVLVVEDSFTVRELQRSILEAAGYRVETARDGSEGFACLLRDDEIVLVLTDLEMPEMDGLELTRAIREDPTKGSTPVVILTTRGDEDDRRRGLEAGADAYMVKRSFDQHALLETVERLVGR